MGDTDTSHAPSDLCLLCTCSAEEEKAIQDLGFEPTFWQHVPDSSPEAK